LIYSFKKKNYKNRSEAVRDLVRDALVTHQQENDEYIVAGCLLIFYDHHQRNLLAELTTVQHGFHDLILATTHFHIDHHNCLEMIVVKGNATQLRDLRDQIISIKGVKYGKLTVSPIEDV